MENLQRAFRAQRVIFTGSTSVYGQLDGERVTEESETAPPRETGTILLEAERLALDAGGSAASLHRLGALWLERSQGLATRRAETLLHAAAVRRHLVVPTPIRAVDLVAPRVHLPVHVVDLALHAREAAVAVSDDGVALVVARSRHLADLQGARACVRRNVRRGHRGAARRAGQNTHAPLQPVQLRNVLRQQEGAVVQRPDLPASPAAAAADKPRLRGGRKVLAIFISRCLLYTSPSPRD